MGGRKYDHCVLLTPNEYTALAHSCCRMSSTNRIGDIERVHQLRAQTKDRRKSVDFTEKKYGRRGSLDYDSDPSNHEMRYLLETR